MKIIKGSLFQRSDDTKMGWHVWRGNKLLGVFQTRAQARVWVRDFAAQVSV